MGRRRGSRESCCSPSTFSLEWLSTTFELLKDVVWRPSPDGRKRSQSAVALRRAGVKAATTGATRLIHDVEGPLYYVRTFVDRTLKRESFRTGFSETSRERKLF